MKLGIMTAVRTNNNGTDLQAYAMQTIFSRYNDDVELINYINDKLENSRKKYRKISIKNLLKYPINSYNESAHERFRRKHLKRSKTIYDSASIEKSNYDIYVAGSDQIWNMKEVNGDYNFMLAFAKDSALKYSYAASLGTNNIKQMNQDYSIAKYLQRLDSVSVREFDNVAGLKEIGISGRYDLDPLLMVDSDEWIKIAVLPRVSRKYIFVYLAEKNHAAVSHALELGKKLGLKVIVYTNGIKPVWGAKNVRFLSVEHWLGYMKNASLVITNSYHCMAIAIALKTNFITYQLHNKPEANLRLSGLARIIHHPALVSERHDELLIPPIDWHIVSSELNQYKSKSFQYVEAICKGVKHINES